METTNLTNQKGINEGNKLIVNFMEIKKQVSVYYLPEFGYYKNNYGTIEYEDTFNLNELKYHKSWDWLMPVVEKIEKLTVKWKISQFNKDGWSKQNKSSHWYEIHIEGNCCDVYEGLAMVDVRKILLPHNDPYFKWTNTSKLYAVWVCCVEFIKWYNENAK